MKTIDDINFKGKRALIRVDFNVPLDKSFNVTDDNRIRATIPTLKKILKGGGSCVLMSHLGRPKEGPEEKYSLKHTVKTTESLLGTSVKFASDCIGDEAFKMSSGLKPGDDIGISYVHSRYKEPLAGPSEIPVLEQGDVCPAFLARDGEGKTYKPVAGGYSFKAVK